MLCCELVQAREVPCTANRRGWPESSIRALVREAQKRKNLQLCDSAPSTSSDIRRARHAIGLSTPKSEALGEKHLWENFGGCDWADGNLQLDRCIGDPAKLLQPESHLTGWRGDFRLLSAGHWPSCCNCGVPESGVGVLWPD